MPLRVIARLDIKAPNLVKGVRMEGLRVIGSPADFAARYFEEGVDELYYQDIVASLYGRNSILDLVCEAAERIFVPLTVGGGLRTVGDIRAALRAGADKVCLNTAAVRRPELIAEAGQIFGRQCVVVAIEAIRQPNGCWKAFTDHGREHTGWDAAEWAERAVDLGAGELLLTSVDREGTQKGFDLDLIGSIAPKIGVPLVVHGGAGVSEDVIQVARLGVDGVVLASVLHYGKLQIPKLKQDLAAAGIEVRT